MKEETIYSIEYSMTLESIEQFLDSEIKKGASENMRRRYRQSACVLYQYLQPDKRINKERLLSWRKDLESKGYASITILNYVKCINRYLDFVGCSAIRFNKGRAKDIRDRTFGYLTAKYPTEKRDRGDIVWVCECKCGKMIELPATRLLLGNTKSCGCIQLELLKRTNKYIDQTSLRQSMDETVISTRNESGYVGVTKKRGKWKATITYKKKIYHLGCYEDIDDAARARARAKELVIADAEGLLNFYEEITKELSPIPSKDTIVPVDYQKSVWRENPGVASAAKRSDNISGHTGVFKKRNLWLAEITYKGERYRLGSFRLYEDAVAEREKAECILKENAVQFIEIYKDKALKKKG